MCRCVDVWVCRCVDVWMCGCVDVWLYGTAGVHLVLFAVFSLNICRKVPPLPSFECRVWQKPTL